MSAALDSFTDAIAPFYAWKENDPLRDMRNKTLMGCPTVRPTRLGVLGVLGLRGCLRCLSTLVMHRFVFILALLASSASAVTWGTKAFAFHGRVAARQGAFSLEVEDLLHRQ